MSIKCEALTKKKGSCPNGAEGFDQDSGKFLCHIHNPKSLFQQQVKVRRAEKQVEKERRVQERLERWKRQRPPQSKGSALNLSGKGWREDLPPQPSVNPDEMRKRIDGGFLNLRGLAR